MLAEELRKISERSVNEVGLEFMYNEAINHFSWFARRGSNSCEYHNERHLHEECYWIALSKKLKEDGFKVTRCHRTFPDDEWYVKVEW